MRYWKAAIRSPHNLLFSRLNSPNSQGFQEIQDSPSFSLILGIMYICISQDDRTNSSQNLICLPEEGLLGWLRTVVPHGSLAERSQGHCMVRWCPGALAERRCERGPSLVSSLAHTLAGVTCSPQLPSAHKPRLENLSLS